MDRKRTAAATAILPGFSLKEEIANSLTHGLGFVLSLVGFGMLVWAAFQRGNVWHQTSLTIYGSSLVALYGASTAYHAWQEEAWKAFLRKLDHMCIYLLIAGTYTPFTLTFLRDSWGWTLFCMVWGLALAGIVYKLFLMDHSPMTSLVLYLLMGWLIVFAIKPAMATIPTECLLWMAAGGLCYTGGVVFFALDEKYRYFHAIWHMFVLGGSFCHYWAIMHWVLP